MGWFHEAWACNSIMTSPMPVPQITLLNAMMLSSDSPARPQLLRAVEAQFSREPYPAAKEQGSAKRKASGVQHLPCCQGVLQTPRQADAGRWQAMMRLAPAQRAVSWAKQKDAEERYTAYARRTVGIVWANDRPLAPLLLRPRRLPCLETRSQRPLSCPLPLGPPPGPQPHPCPLPLPFPPPCPAAWPCILSPRCAKTQSQLLTKNEIGALAPTGGGRRFALRACGWRRLGTRGRLRATARAGLGGGSRSGGTRGACQCLGA